MSIFNHLECPVCSHYIECTVDEELECPECNTSLYVGIEVRKSDFEEMLVLYINDDEI